ncbi:matrix metalloproteinase-19 [Microcaecilia unicolor]|uniref:Matrix metalloproteinase-19 n=1 Tax=Microcaecilia unicolor TaxID=1415580 RepID=A0A6P7XH90_9AMPH|nr:matrix metalloproteinase-19 [Microcaecilia unicolor]XP_030052570.1 matrix metalloproteinase-19 [Microcaecilia unicolor]XP_030052571.1 matrix metalloproteinase-19 [Microcaecilia unicolor]
MNWSQLLLFLLLAPAVPSTTAPTTQQAPQQEALSYLLQFGYLQKPLEKLTNYFQDHEVQEALRVFQAASELPVTGVLDEVTLERMRMPRCGIEDPFNPKTLRYLLLGRWRKKNLTYRIYSYTTDMKASEVRTAIQTAFKYWSDVSPLTFREISYGRADIRISFHQRAIGCSRPFDGPGRVLAHADIPEEGAVHFDEDEFWTEGSYRGVNLRIIAAHEIGHALGLGHSHYASALMAPFYAGYKPNFRLHFDDIAGIQKLYGKRIRPTDADEIPTEPLTTQPVPVQPTSKVPNPCLDDLDAIILGPYDKTYAFKGDYIWTVTDFGINPLMKIKTLWKGLPGNLDAAVYSPRTKRTYFFKGDKVWRYTDFKLNYGYPKLLTRVPPHLNAALYWPVNQKIFLFKGDNYWQWDELGWSNFGLHPKKISSLFTGVPSNLDAALTWKNGKTYFFKGDNYWRVNKQLRTDRGYPLSKSERWMQCHNID